MVPTRDTDPDALLPWMRDIDLPGRGIDWDALPPWMRDRNFFDLTKEWPKFINTLNSPNTALRIPSPEDKTLPPHFVDRPAEFDRLAALLLAGTHDSPVAITSTVALRGAGGFGKTTLALALIHDERIQLAFDDGILWVTLGQRPDVVGGLTKLHQALTGAQPDFVDAGHGATMLAEKLKDRDCLIVIDDV